MKWSARGTNHKKYQHLALFINKHVARTKYKHALISLKSMVNEPRSYRSHEISITHYCSNLNPW
jgi:hypothetical protein